MTAFRSAGKDTISRLGALLALLLTIPGPAPAQTGSPVADPDGPYTGVAGEAVQFDGSGSFDPDGEIVAYSWDFGDGGVGQGAAPTHTYRSAGDYAVTLTVTSRSGLDDSAKTTASIRPAGTIEVDVYPDVSAMLDLQAPDGSQIAAELTGTMTVHVLFETEEGQANDDDQDGLDEVATEMVALELSGTSIVGPLVLRRNPAQGSFGEIEERINDVAGTLDLPPFSSAGMADSFFDVFVELDLEGIGTLLNLDPLHLGGILTHKPAAEGDAYESSTPVDLLTADGQLSGLQIVRLRLVPRPVPNLTEHDVFPETSVPLMLVGGPFGSEPVPRLLGGPAQVDVFFEGPQDGDANDDNGNGRDEVETELVSLNATDGEVTLSLSPLRPSRGQIEETANTTPGLLDVAPFAAPGTTADSFFDVFFELDLGPGGVFHNEVPLRMRTLIRHKPPIGVRFLGPTPGTPIELLDAGGNPSGIFLVRGDHHLGLVEVDLFSNAKLELLLVAPDGETFSSHLEGSMTQYVFFEPGEGEARDDDGDGLEEVQTEVVELALAGSSSVGPVAVRLNADVRSPGVIQEQSNIVPLVLDVAPFTSLGQADSFIDLFVKIEIGTQVLHNAAPLSLDAVLTHKPSAPGEVYELVEPVDLVDANGNPTGFLIGEARLIPNPVPDAIEIDVYPTLMSLELVGGPLGDTPVTYLLGGTATAHVFFEGPVEGTAFDDDGDGLDDVGSELVQLDLTDGSATLSLDPVQPSLGGIEERANPTPEVLDLPPFVPPGGTADSFFDLFFQIDLGDGSPLHNQIPLPLHTVIAHKPPLAARYDGEPPPGAPIELIDSNGLPTGILVLRARQAIGDVEVDRFERVTLEATLTDSIGRATPLRLSGSMTQLVFFEPAEGEARDDDRDGLDEVATELIAMELSGDSPLGAVTLRRNPEQRSEGEIEEIENAHPGTLDLPPFVPPEASAQSFFDLFFELELDGGILLNVEPVRLAGRITHKPAAGGEALESPHELPLFDPFGRPTGFRIGDFRLVPSLPDADGDGVADPEDNCPFVPNPDQEDQDQNGIGTACQCGDVNGDGVTNVIDALQIARGEIGSSHPNFQKCDVNGDGLCNVTDALAIARGEVGSAPEDQLCPAYARP